jgi:hypothetical protein
MAEYGFTKDELNEYTYSQLALLLKAREKRVKRKD